MKSFFDLHVFVFTGSCLAFKHIYQYYRAIRKKYSIGVHGLNKWFSNFSIGNCPTINILRHYTSQFVFLRTPFEHEIYGPIGFDETVFFLEVNCQRFH